MALKDHDLKPKPAPDSDAAMLARMDGLDDNGLLSLRHQIGLRLQTDLSKLDLAHELGAQYRAGMALLESVTNKNDGTPANQRAQVFNSVGAMLEKVIKQQKVVYSAERLKRFEAAFLKVLKSLEPDTARIFFDLYGEYLNADQMPDLAAEEP
ncbi:MAG: hypothetical protein ACEQSK_06880 [Sphingomonadaceae bacterium]